MIVVDNGSTDRSLAIAEQFDCRGINSPSVGNVSHARNTGAKATRGEILLFLDADMACGAQFLSRLKESFDENTHAVALTLPGSHGARVFERSDSVIPGHRSYFGHPKGVVQRILSLLYGYHGLPSGFYAVKRQPFFEVGGFDEEHYPFGGEDYDLYFRLARNGAVAEVESDVVRLVSEIPRRRGILHDVVRWNTRTAVARMKLLRQYSQSDLPIVQTYIRKVRIHLAVTVAYLGSLALLVFTPLMFFPLLLAPVPLYANRTHDLRTLAHVLLVGWPGIALMAATYVYAAWIARKTYKSPERSKSRGA